ncbi:histidine kinase [Microbacterium sp. BK668]|uniref:sensor histidine kinase n=1 Tax=Microbacterium sp. BK668 TaxID=2512118 RepID=UPI00105F498B|nr:histidine kinase [Microbacterium sp. BK668]TDN90627.1 signal transduction histidine kinase [Microbacterium sp. BK668]
MFRRLLPYQIVVDVVLAGLFAAVAAPIELGLGRAVDANALGATLVVVIFAGALAVRRLSPGLSLGLAWLGAIVQMSFGRSPGFADLAIFAVLYATAAYGSRVVFWLGFSSTIVGAGVITLYLFAGPVAVVGLDWSTITTAAAVLIAATFALLLAWTVGALVRTALRARENREAQRRAEDETYAEQERVRIARDMHDVVAHSLAVVIAQADGARYAAASDPSMATAALGTISSTARSALADVRLLLSQLRHSQGDGPQPTLADLEELYAQVRAAGIELRVDVDPAPPGDPPAAVQLAVYRILQEALTNALRHGDGGVVEVRLAWPAERVDLLVRNGVSTDAASRAGNGVIGMRERAQLAGGTLTAEAVDAVFVVRASLPIGVGR